MSYLDDQTRARIHRLVNDLELSSLQAVEVISDCQLVPVVSGLGLAHCILRIDISLRIRRRWWFAAEKWVGFSECVFTEAMDSNIRPYEYRRAAREVEEEVSRCLYESLKARVTKSQFPREQEYVSNFSDWFQFEPFRLSERRYQKEALLKLGLVAARLKECAEAVRVNPRGSREHYEDAFQAFNRRMEALEHFNAEFASLIPHWSELPAFIEKWLEGEELENPQ
jgi:hypothetical protein